MFISGTEVAAVLTELPEFSYEIGKNSTTRGNSVDSGMQRICEVL